jgi:hypothetical protein
MDFVALLAMNGKEHVTVILDGQALVNLQDEIFGLKCLAKTPESYQYRVCVNEISRAIYQALKTHRTSARVVVSDQDGERDGELIGMEKTADEFRLTIKPGKPNRRRE